jgi:hypothetical protein
VDHWARLRKGAIGVDMTFPRCRKCGQGDLVPLSDFGSQGAPIHFKAWVCTNPECLFNIKIRNGEIIINEPVGDGSMHSHSFRNVRESQQSQRDSQR